MLLTSREPLALPSVRRCEVPSLALPAPETGSTPELAGKSPAVRLFVERASVACHGFALDASNTADVIALCRRLDGLPLALELAASRVCSLGVVEVLERLDGRFHLLDDGRGPTAPRRRALCAVIDWSWELLSECERAVLRRLAVFSGGCDLAAVEVVCSGGGVRPEEVAGALAWLVDCSLVVSARSRDAVPQHRERRFHLLETIASYSGERLRESNEHAFVSHRHLEHYISLVCRAAPLLRSGEQRRALTLLDAESANIRTALDRALQEKDAESAWTLSESLTWYWLLRGRMAEGRGLLYRLVCQRGALAPEARNDLDGWWAGLALLDGGGADTDGHVERIVERLLGSDEACSRRTSWFLSYALLSAGGDVTGASLASRALGQAKESGDRWTEAATLCVLAGQAQLRGDLEDVHHQAGEGHRL